MPITSPSPAPGECSPHLSYFFNIHFNSFLSPLSRSLFFRSSYQNPVYISPIPVNILCHQVPYPVVLYQILPRHFIYLLFFFHHRAAIYDKIQLYSRKCNIMYIEAILYSLSNIIDTTGSCCCFLNILSVWTGYLLETNGTFVHCS